MFLRRSLRLSSCRRLCGGVRLRAVHCGNPTNASIHNIINTFHQGGHDSGAVHFSTALTDDEVPAEVSDPKPIEVLEDEVDRHEEEVSEEQNWDEVPDGSKDETESQAQSDQVVSKTDQDEEKVAASDDTSSDHQECAADTDDLEATTERLIAALQVYGDYDNEEAKVKLVEFDDAIEAWAERAATRNGCVYAADKASELLEALEKSMTRMALDNTSMTWNIAWYNNVMHAYAVCHGGRQAAEKAEAILQRMMKACQEYEPNDATFAPPEPNTQSFNIVINAWAKSAEPDSGRHAEGIVARMEQWFLECKENSVYHGAVGNARTMSGVIDAWAQSGVHGAEERVLSILMYTIERQRASLRAKRDGVPHSEGSVVKPNVIMFNSVIHAWVNSNRGQEGAEQAEGILRMMEKLAESNELGEVDENNSDDVGLKPNTRTLSLVIDAWAQSENTDKTGEAAQHAQDILDMMEKLYREGQDVKPSYVSFTSCIAAWSRSVRHPDAAERAEALLDRLLNLYEETGDKDFNPTTSTFNAVISAFAKSERVDSIERAKAIFERLKDFCKPDVYSYNSVINAYAKKGEGLAAKMLLQEMEDACDSGNSTACPDLATYNTVIHALSKSSRLGSAEEAEELLSKIKTLTNQGRTDLKPTPATYTSVITAWARARQPENSYRLLRAAIDAYTAGDENMKPDVKMFTAAINACARTRLKFTEHKRRVLKIAIQTFEELKSTAEFGNPNDVTYRFLMKSCIELSVDPAEKSRLLRAIFQQACQDGMVSKLVVATLSEGVARDEFVAIVGCDRRYPYEWSRKIPRRDRP